MVVFPIQYFAILPIKGNSSHDCENEMMKIKFGLSISFFLFFLYWPNHNYWLVLVSWPIDNTYIINYKHTLLLVVIHRQVGNWLKPLNTQLSIIWMKSSLANHGAMNSRATKSINISLFDSVLLWYCVFPYHFWISVFQFDHCRTAINPGKDSWYF